MKTEQEIKNIREAQKINDETFSRFLKKIELGMTELDLAAMIEKTISELGGEGLAFDTIAAFGENATEPHAIPSARALKPGDFILTDFGAKYNGLCSDMTRTVAFKKVSDMQKKIYEAVLSAQILTIKKLAPYALAEDIHTFCQTRISISGFLPYFTHGTGHGVGAEIHEKPSLSTKMPKDMTAEEYEKSDTKILPNHVVTVEPGIYYKPRFGKKIGVRIEDMILIKENGAENLTKSPKHLIILE